MLLTQGTCMKKLLIFLCFFMTTVFAKDIVTIYYAFGPADSMSNYSRTLVEEANKIQNKYTFVFDTKPGAGGAVATNWIKLNPTNSMVMTASPFFIRPNFYPNESYNINDFKVILPQCLGPIAVSSIKYQAWKDIPIDKSLTVGVTGLGTTTHLVALQLQKKYSNIQIIPFKSASEVMVTMLGGNIDMSIGFLSDPENWSYDNKIKMNILGITGSKIIHNHPTLSSQGFPDILTKLNVPHNLIVSSTVPDQMFTEWRKILVTAAKSKSVRESYSVDSCEPMDQMPDNEIQPWFNAQNIYWKQLTSGVKIDQ